MQFIMKSGMDYILLVLVKLGKVDTMIEKSLNRWFNLLLRWPIQLICSYIIIINIVDGRVITTTYVIWCMYIGIFLHGANAIYYCNKVVGNFHVKAATLNMPAENMVVQEEDITKAEVKAFEAARLPKVGTVLNGKFSKEKKIA